MKQLIDDMGVGMLTNLRLEMVMRSRTGVQPSADVLDRWAEDIAIALHLPVEQQQEPIAQPLPVSVEA